MAHTYEELKKKTVAELRDIAAGIEDEAVKGYTQLNKEHLLAALCKALHIDTHAHHHAVASNKSGMKAQIRELKQKREAAISAHDRAQMKALRRQIHELKHQLRRQTV